MSCQDIVENPGAELVIKSLSQIGAMCIINPKIEVTNCLPSSTLLPRLKANL